MSLTTLDHRVQPAACSPNKGLPPSGLRAHPIAVWLLLLGLVSSVEFGVMLVLPLVLPHEPTPYLESAVDSVFLMIVIAPWVWWMVVRPLRVALGVQAGFLADSLARIEAERRNIAHELHDGVGQSLTLLVSGLRSWESGIRDADSVRRCRNLQRQAQAALAEIRKLSLGLRPSVLDDLGLAPAIERVASEIAAAHPIEVTVDVNDVAGSRLPENVETALFRIFQEAMNNVVKHSRAQHAHAAIHRKKGMIVLEVRDDGGGMAPNRGEGKASPTGHLGLIGMQERAALLGGSLLIESAPNRGTCVRVTVPERRTR